MVCDVVMVPNVPPRKSEARLRERDLETRRLAAMSMESVRGGSIPPATDGVWLTICGSVRGGGAISVSGDGGVDGGGTSSWRNCTASGSVTAELPPRTSILFPTTAQQKS